MGLAEAKKGLLWPIKGVRVEGDKVIIAVKGGNDVARRLCGELLDMFEGELHQLEQALAYSSARSDIECYCNGSRHSGPHIGVWYDITSPEPDEAKEMVNEAVRYLELRKLLKRHPENSDMVRPLDIEAIA